MEKLIVESKEQLTRSEKQKIERELVGGSWRTRERVALACRILHSNGHDSGLAGQVTMRESEGTFLTQRLGCGLSEVTPSSLLRVDDELNVLIGAGMPNPANRFHAWLYRARPDVKCIVHTHPLHCSALSMLGVPLVISHMDGCALYDNVALLEHWPGVPVGDAEGRLISNAIGNKSGLLLAHHGIVVVGRTVDEACVLAVQLERAAQLQLLANAAGTIRPMTRELGLEARDWLLNARRLEATFAYYARVELARDPQCLA